MLRQGRTDLATQHGEDPLDESREIAAQAKRQRDTSEGGDPESPDFASSKRVKPMLAISQELDKDDEEDEEERARLSEIPEKLRSAKVKRSPATAFRGQDPDEGIFDASTGLVLKRRRWSEEEKTAVKEGVRKHGVGHWVKIKDEYADILRNRTAIQIKDCWRTMTKRNEVHFKVTETENDKIEVEEKVEPEEPPKDLTHVAEV